MDALGPRHIHGHGTPEASWQAWEGLEALPCAMAADLVPENASVFVVAPHPDDELLGAGGLMALLKKAGREVHVVLVTDGSGSHHGSSIWSAQRLAAVRPHESREALDALGLHDVHIWQVAIPDGSVADQERQLAEVLTWRIRPADVIVTTWRLDGHPDHEATARACSRCIASLEATLLEMPVWGWHWMSPGEAAFPWERACRVALPPDILQRKRRAAEAFVSQTRPDPSIPQDAVLPSWALERLLRPYEVFIR